MSARLGPFLLDHELARGGMGTVWLAHHADRPLRAAVKIIEHSADNARGVLDHELRATAALQHPTIVKLFDTGTVDEAAARAAQLERGDRWIAMELIRGGTLLEHRPTEWRIATAILEGLLDALAHAHARGVVHRDLKPQNVLLRDDGSPVLVDFGIASRLVGPTGPGRPGQPMAGTPVWMSPEQFSGGAIGPWTDLYGLGVVAWWMCTGTRLFRHRSTWQLMRAHLEQEPPEFVPAVEGTPAGLEDWLRLLLAKSPRDRYRRAADALRALRALPHTAAPLRLPADPAAGQRPSRPLELSLRGLALSRLQEVPLVGRRREQERLWQSLRQVHDGGGASHLVTLEGPLGVGASRLARWLCHRAHELGAGSVFRVHALKDGPNRVTDLLDAAPDLAASDPLLKRIRDPQTPVAERHALVDSLLLQLGEDRPRIVWIDDAQWAPELLALVPLLLASSRTLVVLTIRTDVPDDDESADEALDAARASAGAVRIPLGPLSPDARQALVDALGDLDPYLGQQLSIRTAGNPAFAVTLLDDWAARGLLVPGPSGLKLAPGADTRLPSSLGGAWLQRVDALLEGRPSAWRAALEAAAALGEEIDAGQWAEVCRRLEVEIPRGLVPTLLVSRLAVQDTAARGLRWRFAHGLLREAIETRTHAEGRAEPLHRAALAMLGSSPRQRARRAHHHIALGETSQAVTELARAARGGTAGSELSQADRMLQRARGLAAALEPTDAAHLWLMLAEADLAADRHDVPGCLAVTERLAALAHERGEPLLEGRALGYRATVLQRVGRAPEALEAVERSVDLLDQAGASAGLVAAQEFTRAVCHLSLCRYDEALHDIETLLQNLPGRAELDARLLRVLVLTEQGRVETAREELEVLRPVARSGNATTRANLAYMDCAVLRAEGDPGRAVTALASAIEERFGLGSNVPSWLAEQIDLLVALGRLSEAQRTADLLAGSEGMEVDTARALVSALHARWTEAESHLMRAASTRFDAAIPHLARRLEHIGDLALRARRSRVAAVALDLAGTHWRRCGQIDRATAAEDRAPTLEVAAQVGQHRLHALFEPAGGRWRCTDGAGNTTSVSLLPETSDLDARAAAAATLLAHPGLASIIDVGVVTEEEAARSAGLLAAGTAWVATRALDGPGLPEAALPWPQVAPLISSMLDTLAHLHALGALHLGLHPDSIVMEKGERPVITDAAVAVLAPGHAPPTPRWLAPEQLRREHDRLGPWTDLHGLGLIVWKALTGAPLHDTDNPWKLLRSHDDEPPPFRAYVPAGVEGWLRTLLAPEPEERFQRAAHAAAALGAIERISQVSTDALKLADSRVTLVPRGRDEAPPDRIGPPLEPDAPPWLDGPLVGHETEREALWGALVQVRAGIGRVVVLLGSPDASRRLESWLCYAASALGYTQVIGPPSTEEPDPARALAREALRVGGLSPEQTTHRLQRRGVEQADALGAWLNGRSEPGPDTPALLGAALDHAAGDRLVPLVRLGELEAPGVDALAAALMTCELPCLVLATAAVDRAAPDEERAAWEWIEVRDPRARSRNIASRTAATWRAAVSQLLTDGPASWMPALAVAALLGDRVEINVWRDAQLQLQMPAPGGLMRALLDAGLALPETDVARLAWRWVHPAARAEATRHAGERTAETHLACSQVLAPRGPSVAERRAAHLERADEIAAAVDVLLQARPWIAARDLGREARLLERCEVLLERLPDDDARHVELLIGQASHLVRNGQNRRALTLASQASERAEALGEPTLVALALGIEGRTLNQTDEREAAERVLSRAAALLRDLGRGRELAVALSDLGLAYLVQFEYTSAEEASREAVAVAVDAQQRSETTLTLCAVLIEQRREDEARRLLEGVRPHVFSDGTSHAQAMWWFMWGGMHWSRGDLGGAEGALRSAIAAKRAHGGPSHAWQVDLAGLLLDQGRIEDARRVVDNLDQAWKARVRGAYPELLAHIAALDGAWDAVASTASTVRPPLRSRSVLQRWTRIAQCAEAAGQRDLARRIYEWVVEGWRLRRREDRRAWTEERLQELRGENM